MGKSQKKSNTKAGAEATDVQMYRHFKLYTNSTGQVPKIVINLIKPDLYLQGINILLEILKVTRDSDTVIPFKVRSHTSLGIEKEKLPTFLIKCSDLYIIGYKINENYKIYRDTGKKGFPSLKYLDKNEHNLVKYGDIIIQAEKNRKLIKENWEKIHYLAHIVAEAIRDEKIEESVEQLIINNNHVGRRDNKIFGNNPSNDKMTVADEHKELKENIDKLYAASVSDFENSWKSQSSQQDLINTNKILEDSFRLVISGPRLLTFIASINGCTVQELLSGEFANNDQDQMAEEYTEEYDECNTDEEDSIVVGDREQIEELMNEMIAKISYKHEFDNQLLQAERLMAPKLLPIAEIILPHIDTMRSIADYNGARIKPLNSSQIKVFEEGLYKETPSGSGYYAKIEGSGINTCNFVNSNGNNPDDDKGGSGIAITTLLQADKNNIQYTIIEWINNIDNKDVRDYLLSLGVIQGMVQRFAEKENFMRKPKTIDFIIKPQPKEENSLKIAKKSWGQSLTEISAFGSCMFLKNAVGKNSLIVENPSVNENNNINLCTGFSMLAGITYSNFNFWNTGQEEIV